MPSDGFAAAEFIVRRLYRPVGFASGEPLFAAAETEHRLDGDVWFWTDDNAKILEFLSRPELWRRHPGEFAEILRFVRAMCRGPFIFRRVAAPRLDPAEPSGGFARWRHALMTIGADLGRGIVAVGARFHDERGAELWLTGNHVEFRYRGRQHRLAVEPAIDETAASLEDGRLTLRHASDLHFTAGGRRRRLGRIAYSYSFDAGSTAIAAEAALDIAPGIDVEEVVLTFGHRHLARYRDAAIVDDRTADGMPLFTVGRPTTRRLNLDGAGYYQFRQGRISGDAPAIHSRPRDPGRLAAIDIAVRRPWVPHRVETRYAFPGRHGSGRLAAAETKMLTSGGLYRRPGDYAGFLGEAAAASRGAVLDYSLSYDYGAVINAFATSFAVCAAGTAPNAAALGDELRADCDRYLDTYFRYYADEHESRPDAIFSRELAFVAMAAATMFRATGADRYRDRLRRLCDILLDFELPIGRQDGHPVSAFLMRAHSPEAGTADCHSAVLLALVRAAPLLGNRRIAAAVGRGLGDYRLHVFDRYLGHSDRFEAVATGMAYNYRRHYPLLSHLAAWRYRRRTQPAGADPIVWSYKAALALRLFRALRQSDDAALQTVAAEHGARLAAFDARLRHLLAGLVRDTGDGIEILNSPRSGEGNSETQPWAMLGLLGHPCD